MKAKIRKAVKKDLKEVAEIFRKETAKKPYFQKRDKKTTLKKINEFFKKEDVYVIIVNKKIVGFIVSHININGKEAQIKELWLKTDHQGKGLGTALMEFIEKKYKKKKVKEIGVVANKKARALYFYEKLKYKKKHDFFYMSKKLR